MEALGPANDTYPGRRAEMKMAREIQKQSDAGRKQYRRWHRRQLRDAWWQSRITEVIEERINA